MMNQNENRVLPTRPAVEIGAKKPYQTPELTAHGRVNEVTLAHCYSCIKPL